MNEKGFVRGFILFICAIFLAFNFGLPVIATDVGSLRESIIEGENGFICRPCDPDDLSKTIKGYYDSKLFKNLEQEQKKIISNANKKYSWDKIGEKTYSIYNSLL